MCPRTPLLAAVCLSALAFPSLSSAQERGETPELAPVVVTATRQETRANEVLADVTVIGREEIERSAQGTITDLLARQPGIDLPQSGGAGTQSSLFLRGANFNQTKVLVDGIELSAYDGTAAALRFVPLAEVERIEILRGPSSSLYGANTIGGVIQIFTRRGQKGVKADAFAGYGSHDTRQFDAGLSAGDAHWRVRVDANHFATSGISSRKDGINRDGDKDAYHNTGGGLAASFLPAEGHEIGASYRSSQGVVHYDGGPSWPNVTPADGNYDNHEHFEIEQWRLFSRNRILPVWESEISYSEARETRKDYNTFNVPTGSMTRSQTKNRQWTWQNNVDLPLGRALFAIEHLKQSADENPDIDYMGNPIYDHAPEFHNTSVLAGWTANHGNNRWQINLRRDRHSEFGSKTTYGASYGYQFTEALRAHIGYATAFRAPSIVELYRPLWGGNPELKPEEAKNAETGLTWEKGTHRASAIYYHNRVKNLITWSPNANPPAFGTNENVEKALLAGVTLAYQGTFDAWRLSASYDWLNARNESHDANYERLGRRARNKGALALARTWGKFETGAEVVAVGKRFDGNYRKNASDKEVLGGYTLFNLTGSYAFAPDWRLEARLNNLFDKKYETARYYGTEGFTAFIGLRYAPK
ncbi:MAG: TonB-dependent receptor [Azoarcus sp.]|nr:TonB-dependent receptor [Azoarcus sp.]